MSVGTFWTNISTTIGKPKSRRRPCSVPVLTEFSFSPRTPIATCVTFDRSRSHIYLNGVPLYEDQLQQEDKMLNYKELAINGPIPKWSQTDLSPQIIRWHIKTAEKDTWTSKNLKQTDLTNGGTITDEKCGDTKWQVFKLKLHTKKEKEAVV